MQLLERETQFQLLEGALREVEKGAGSVALVYGEAGIGKTSLVEHFLQQHTDSYRILRGACDALFTPRPLGPLHDVAQQTRGPLLKKLEATADRTAIFSAALAELAGEPTIMLVEDIHWADEATLDLLKYLGRRVRQTPSLLIFTYRDDELGQEHPVRHLLGDLTTTQAVRRIPLPPLSQDAVRSLAGDRQINTVELHRLTNGNPFLVTEVLATDGGIPETVRDAVLARAAHLSPAARTTLEAAAIIGLLVEPWLLAVLAHVDAQYVEECIAVGTLQIQGDLYAFRHELTRQTLLDDLTPDRKVALHRLALQALQETAETRSDLARLANHAEGAQDASLVLEYAPRAAQRASDLGAHLQAYALYGAAVHHASKLPPEQRAQLLESLAEECEICDRLVEAEQTQSEALRLRRQLGQRENEGRALRRLSEIALRSGQQSLAEGYAAEAISVLETEGVTRELAMAYSHRSRIHMVLYQAADAMAWGERARDMAEELHDDETLMHALNNTGTVEMWHNQLDTGRRKLERGIQLALERNRDDHAARAFYNLAAASLANFDYAGGLSAVSDGLDFCADRDMDNWRLGLWGLRARALFEQGAWAKAHEAVDSAPRSAGQMSLEPRLHLLRLRLRVRRGEVISPVGVEELRTTAYASAFHEMSYPLAATLAEMAWLGGDLEHCQVEALDLYKRACEVNVPRWMGELAYWMWRAGAITEPPPGAAEPFASQVAGDWKRAAGLWKQLGCPYERGMALMDGDEAAQLQALKIFEELGARPIIEKLRQQLRAQGVHGIPRGPRPSTRENAFGLTARELEVLGCLVKGSSNSVIAKQLSLSTRTVEHHIASIFQKTSTQSRGEAAAMALRENLVAPS